MLECAFFEAFAATILANWALRNISLTRESNDIHATLLFSTPDMEGAGNPVLGRMALQSEFRNSRDLPAWPEVR